MIGGTAGLADADRKRSRSGGDFRRKSAAWSHERMTDSARGPRAKTAGEYLRAARARLEKDRRVQGAAQYGLRLLSQILDELRGEIDGWEMAELTAVYDTLAMLVADALDIEAAEAFRALAVLCDDKEALRLTRGQAEPTSKLLRLLRERLLWVTVTYDSGMDGRCGRVTDVAYRNAVGDPMSARAAVELGYDDLPGRVRERMISGGQQAVRYQLYPAPALTSRPAGSDERNQS
jgi:hypothetical protein